LNLPKKGVNECYKIAGLLKDEDDFNKILKCSAMKQREKKVTSDEACRRKYRGYSKDHSIPLSIIMERTFLLKYTLATAFGCVMLGLVSKILNHQYSLPMIMLGLMEAILFTIISVFEIWSSKEI